MAAELSEQAIRVEWRATEITARTLKELIQQLVDGRNRIQFGEQKLAMLNKQGRQLESVDLHSQDIKAFRQQLRKYSVDFSVMKDRASGNYSVFFKSQDVDRVYAGLAKCVEQMDGKSRRPMKEVMQEAEQRAAARQAERSATVERERSAERGRDSR